MNTLTKGKVIKYSLLPGFLPRIKTLFGPGRGHIAFWMAIIYGAVRLLPSGHPYLKTENLGRFGVRHVIAEAGRNLTWDWRHADQIVVFFTMLTGIVLFFMQVFLLIAAMIAIPALAMPHYSGVVVPTSPFDIFITPDPTQDVAFIFLDMVFGIPDIFNSCVATGVPCEDTRGLPLPNAIVGAFPTPFQLAFHEILEMYSYGIFIAAIFILLYFVTTTVGEMAESGSPFGRRFNRLWAPLRLMFFFFALAPLAGAYGLNQAQMWTLRIASFGSSMATNGWYTFLDGITIGGTTILGTNEADAPLGERWIVTPRTPDPGTFLQFMQTATACKYAQRLVHDRYIQAYVVRNEEPGGQGALHLWKTPFIDEETIPGPPGPEFTSLDEALDFVNNGDITIRYGEYNPLLYTDQKGFVYPWCGEVVIPNPGVLAYNINERDPGIYWALFNNFVIIAQQSWGWIELHDWGDRIARNILNNETEALPDGDDMRAYVDFYRLMTADVVEFAVQEQIALGEYAVSPEVRAKGWAGAAIWYNRIAEANGGLIDAVNNVPQPKLWPAGLEQILNQKKSNNDNIAGPDRFDMTLPNGRRVSFEREEDADIARVERFAYNMWLDGAALASPTGREIPETRNAVIDAINAIFGTQGLFDMRENADQHPLAQLVGAGKGLINSSIRAFGFVVGTTVGSGIWGMLGGAPPAILGTMSEMAKSVAIAGLLAGVILFYVVPFMPFIYFFFAVMGWVKAVFEAMVGVPLWALAHIRIEGDGLPGPGGMNGYFLIFEIFVRPILIIFGLIAAISVFAAAVSVLNEIFELVVTNLTGRDPNDLDPDQTPFFRAAIDQLFYTVIYVVIVYMIGLSCFKLVDLVPDQIMRWLGASVTAFGDAEKNSAGQLLHKVSYGSTGVVSQMGEAGGMMQGALNAHFVGR